MIHKRFRLIQNESKLSFDNMNQLTFKTHSVILKWNLKVNSRPSYYRFKFFAALAYKALIIDSIIFTNNRP